jgi:hypothetical protein
MKKSQEIDDRPTAKNYKKTKTKKTTLESNYKIKREREGSRTTSNTAPSYVRTSKLKTGVDSAEMLV